MQSKPAKEHWIDLAQQGGTMGREDCQEGWHRLVSTFRPGRILDVGTGLGKIKERIPNCTTQDPCEDVTADIHLAVPMIATHTYELVTAFDVIEHVVEDITFLKDLCRIAIWRVFISTPNYNVSKAANGCHCREYTPQEFVDLVTPFASSFILWAGDGKGLHPTSMGIIQFLHHSQPHHAALIRVRR